MKRNIKFLSLLFLIFAMIILSGCNRDKPNTPDKIEITPTSTTITTSEVNLFDFTKLFIIKVNDKEIEVLETYIDKSNVLETAGVYEVICTYKTVTSKATVTVNEEIANYVLSVKSEKIELKVSEVAEFDFKSLFTLTKNGETIEITDDLITSNVVSSEGEYEYSVAINDIVKKVEVIVLPDHKLEIINAYDEIKLTIDEVGSFDLTKLFLIYADDIFTKVETSMIDASSLVDIEIGASYDVTITYEYYGIEMSSSAKITIVSESETIINSKNVITYPNSEYIDLTSLFEIKVGNELIDVTMDMITGTIDYSQEGENVITLNYNNQVKQAIVTVKRGVVINYAKADTVTIVKGTKQDTYSFINDFKLIINGILFDNISKKYFDFGDLDFNTPGRYEVTLKINYNDKPITGLTGTVKFEEYTKTITYEVVENVYDLKINKEFVTLPKGTTSYNPFNNIILRINSRNQALTEYPEYVDIITTYAKIISTPIDFNSYNVQNVVIEVYVYGPSYDPVVVNFDVLIESDIKVTTENRVMFTGGSIYPKDLFTVTKGNEVIEIENSMVKGYLDLLTPGIYELELNYEGFIANASVVVLDREMVGSYKTNLMTIAYESDVDDEGYEIGGATSKRYPALVINENGEVKFGTNKIQLLDAIDEQTLIIKLSSSIYELKYHNGIITLNPNNDIKLGFTDYRRPFVFFNENVWTLNTKVTINSSSDYVLKLTYGSYSIDAFKITNKQTNEVKWYGLKTHLVEKSSSDTIYDVTFGYIEFASNFDQLADLSSSLTLNDLVYRFKMNSTTSAKILANDSTSYLYANRIFKGTIDGKEAQLRFNSYENATIQIDGKQVASCSKYEINSMYNGGLMYETNTVFLYSSTNPVYSYKFIVDTSNNTFTYVEKDNLYGLYRGEKSYIFLDGYGSGVINFNTSSYSTTLIRYTINNNLVNVRFIDTKPTFEYGKELTLVVADLLNKITIHKSENNGLMGKTFVNEIITNGAIVNVKSVKVGKGTKLDDFLKTIEIVTKDGVLGLSDVKARTNTKSISFSKPGFYQFTITIDVCGTNVVSYYAIEVIDILYENNSLVATYGAGTLNSNNSIMIDKYGQAFLNANGVIYSGYASISEDETKASIIAYNGNQMVTLECTKLVEGMIQVRCTGATSFNDYFTIGTVKVAGTTDLVIREYTINTNKYYMLSYAQTTLGKFIDIEYISGNSFVEGSIIKFNDNNKDIIVKINKLDDFKNGLTLADKYIGTYTNSENTLVIDGFGNATYNGDICKYEMNLNTATLTFNSTIKVLKLNVENRTFEELEVKLDNSLVEGYTYTSSYNFYCGSYLYLATTSFTFRANGQVIVKTSSSEHDEGEYMCEDDRYEAPFGDSKGVSGTYSVTNNRLTIIVNGYTFVFVINNVTNPVDFTTLSTTLPSTEHGYFKVGNVFMR